MSELASYHTTVVHDPSIGLIEGGLSPAEQANFQGDWMLLQRERMMGSDFREKFEQYLNRHIPSLNGGELGPRDKPKQFQPHYENQRDRFDLNIEHVYAAVMYGKAKAIGQGYPSGALGHGTIGEQGTLYSDAVTREGNLLTDRQKNIIGAHEQYHGMVDAQGSAVTEVLSGFDLEAYYAIVDNGEIKKPSHPKDPDELLARMAQLKNYYGMSADEPFTDEHLAYARVHYVKDTGLDNGMSVFFKIVTPETTGTFLRLMKELPI